MSAATEQADAIESATLRLLRGTLLFGVAGSLVALFAALQQRSAVATVLLAVGWAMAWTAAAARPGAVMLLLRRWYWSAVLVGCASVGSIMASGGFDSLLKAEASWLAWAAPVVLGTAASLGIAAILSVSLLSAFLLDDMSLGEIVSGPDRYTAVTDVLNPMVVVLVALALTGVFRSVLTNASQLLWRARRGGPASSPAMAALLAGRPRLALPAGELEGSAVSLWERLTPSERDIVERLASGQTPKQIALVRGVRGDTVYDQIGSAKQKTGAKTIEHLVVVAWPRPS